MIIIVMINTKIVMIVHNNNMGRSSRVYGVNSYGLLNILSRLGGGANKEPLWKQAKDQSQNK